MGASGIVELANPARAEIKVLKTPRQSVAPVTGFYRDLEFVTRSSWAFWLCSSNTDWRNEWFWFSKIESREDALSVVKSASYVFFALAAFQAGIAAFLLVIGTNGTPDIFFTVALFLLASILRRWNSRFAAITLFFLSIADMGMTILARVEIVQTTQNILLATIAIGAGI